MIKSWPPYPPYKIVWWCQTCGWVGTASRMSKVCPKCRGALPKRTNDYDDKAKQLFESVQAS